MKSLIKSHSYTFVEYKCEEYEFLATNDLTKKILNTDKFEFGLCGKGSRNSKKKHTCLNIKIINVKIVKLE